MAESSEETASPDEGADLLDATHSPQVLAAVHELVPLLYEELHRTARRERKRFSVGDTLATTVLVNEVYMRLAASPGFGNRSHFLAVAAIAMRRILIESIRAQVRVKRGGEFQRVGFEQALDIEIADDEKILAINDALQALAQRSPRLAQIVECRFFAGYSERETAEALDISERTVQRDWATARAWLQRQVEQVL
ncbi:sigma-70 family RNA polymerase sigma factor [Pseudoxanthomonas helianthi]|uniref:Sigma-70 family RNA polymerase sigma factor n=1 Tax=Pseudoxanthomonas helianthi TaxID=1453541 RepID=A0A941ATC9_9GAMM|nr:ECF-type sigma factor [Pseudoxanthomonas helianthi]MBP3984134.1 sigma-70 family RNA polymerase sigma factor [Pseudoxanthomonas helianthi]